MHKKLISLFLAFILGLTSLCSCKGGASTNANSKGSKLPYYSITTEFSDHEKNYYMELDVRIPKITYSGVESDELIDSINKEIYGTISSLISDAKAQALETYNAYLDTARSNTQKDQDSRLSELDTKYKEVFNDTAIDGHASTDVVIDPNLHNKNIIIVETTVAAETAEVAKTSTSSEPKKSRGERPNFENSEKGKSERDKLSTQNETKAKTDASKKASSSDINRDLTIDDYYKELAEIDRMTLPRDNELLEEYTPTKILCNFDVKCLDEDYISLFVEFSEIKTVPNLKRFFYNIDLHDKKILTIKDLLGENYKTLCADTINSSIETFSDEVKSNLRSDYNIEEYIKDDMAFFINSNHIPVIELDKFTLTPSYLEFQVTK